MKPRRKTRTTGFPRSFDKVTSAPSMVVSVKSGASAPSDTVSDSTGMVDWILGEGQVRRQTWNRWQRLCYHPSANEDHSHYRPRREWREHYRRRDGGDPGRKRAAYAGVWAGEWLGRRAWCPADARAERSCAEPVGARDAARR